MKKHYVIFCICLLVLANTPSKITMANSRDRTFLIRLKNLEIAKVFASNRGLEIIEVIDETKTILVEHEGVLTDEVKEDLMSDSNVIYIEPNYRISIPENEVFTYIFSGDKLSECTDDPLWDSDIYTKLGQWNMRVIGLERAWELEEGSESVIVSILDTGIAYDNPEIADSYLPGGYDWIHENYDPYDDNNHGSWVAGIIAAKKDNQIGIAGTADVRIMAEKVLDGNGGGSVSNLVMGLIHAADLDVDIINLSLGTDSYSQALKDAVDYAHSKGCLLVAAAGNSHHNDPHYPGAFDNVISVAATYGEPDDIIAPYSNYGDWVDLSGPGGWDEDRNHSPSNGEYWILSIAKESDMYMYGTGTSGAVPHVSGLAALCLSKFPSATNQELTEFLINSVEDKGDPNWDRVYGHGRVNAEQALLITPSQSVGGEAETIGAPVELSDNLFSYDVLVIVSIGTLLMALLSYRINSFSREALENH